MTLKRAELKSRARQSLSGNYGVMCLSVLMIEMISLLLAMLFYSIAYSRIMSAVEALIIVLLMSVLYAGFFNLCLKVSRGVRPAFTDLFACFQRHPDKVILMALLIGAIDAAASIPFIVLIVISNRDASWISFVEDHPYFSLQIDLLITVVWLIWLMIVNSPFTCTVFLYLDQPGRKTLDFVRDSRRLMKGQCGKFIKLMLSFIGMLLLGVLSFGIGLIWVIPYMGACCAQFYLNLRKPE